MAADTRWPESALLPGKGSDMADHPSMETGIGEPLRGPGSGPDC
jgi:hypothetical protein